jgi:flagellin-like protein
MELKHLLTADDSERAVSPVIGVILMVAITVILAAVIGTFVLGLGDQVQQTSPNAQWNWEQTSGGQLNVTHEGGDSIEATTLSVSGPSLSDPGACTSGDGGGAGDFNWTSSTVTAGDTCELVDTGVGSDQEYRLIWTAEGGGSSSTLTSYTTN